MVWTFTTKSLCSHRSRTMEKRNGVRLRKRFKDQLSPTQRSLSICLMPSWPLTHRGASRISTTRQNRSYRKRELSCLAALSGKPFRNYELPLSSSIASMREARAKLCLLNILLLLSTNGFTSISILQKKVFVSISRILQNEKKQKNDCTRVKSASVP